MRFPSIRHVSHPFIVCSDAASNAEQPRDPRLPRSGTWAGQCPCNRDDGLGPIDLIRGALASTTAWSASRSRRPAGREPVDLDGVGVHGELTEHDQVCDGEDQGTSTNAGARGSVARSGGRSYADQIAGARRFTGGRCGRSLISRPPRPLVDCETVDLGGKEVRTRRVRHLATPHVPHNWESQVPVSRRPPARCCAAISAHRQAIREPSPPTTS